MSCGQETAWIRILALTSRVNDFGQVFYASVFPSVKYITNKHPTHKTIVKIK